MAKNETVSSSVQTIAATAGDNHAEVSYDFGANLTEAVEKFGEDVVFSNFKQSAVIAAQSIIRRALNKKDADGNAAPESAEAIQAIIDGWKPGISTRTTVSKKDKAIKAMAGMTAEEIQAVLDSLAEANE